MKSSRHFFKPPSKGVVMSTDTKTKPTNLHSKLLEVLGEVDRPGDVCTSGDRPLTMPGLEVEGLGSVGLPLSKSDARKLIKLCRQAPYGKGTETVVDTDVRRVWELGPKKFRLTNPKWNPLVASIVSDIQAELGLAGQKLKAQLYKLLVYEEGSFFLPHRDGEKLDRMVATLVIGLPSVHEGGELIVSHNGQQHEIIFAGAASGYELSHAAFYADCQHEVRPVRSGYRLCLTYNVTLAGSRGKGGITAPSFEPMATAIGELLNDWSDYTDAEKIAVTLDHRYTQDGLTIDKLKGIDRARADVLFEAAEKSDCVAHLALMTLWQTGSSEGGYDQYSYGHRRGYHHSDDEDDAEYDNTTNQYAMGEIFDDSLSADHWSDRMGNKVCLRDIVFSADEIVADQAMDETEPNCEDFEGFTGNAGMTLQRWYHRAAVIIWPRAKHFQVLCGAGTDAAVGGLATMVKNFKRATKTRREQKRQECLSFAATIIDLWKPFAYRPSWEQPGADRNLFPVSLCALNDPLLVRRFLTDVMPADSTVQLDKTFGKFCKQHGWASFEQELTAVIEATTAATIARNAELLRLLCVLRDASAERIELCGRLSERMVQAVETLDNASVRDWQTREVDRAALLGSLVTAMLAVGAEKPLGRMIDYTLSCGKFDLTDAHLTAMFSLEKRLAKLTSSSAAVSRWVSTCRRELEKRTSKAPQKPTDYRRTDKLSCDCKDCGALAAFLADPNQKQARFPLAKGRRQHLHQIIETNRCDCRHETERRGRPYTLVCTKTTVSYKAACETHNRDQGHLARVVRIEKELYSLS
jgi:hypothetical protein